MPVNTPHTNYTEHVGKWKRCRDTIAGSDAVKIKEDTYLPRLTKQSDSQYKAYVQRANFYGATARTHQGLIGAVFRKDYELETTDPEIEQYITREGLDLTDLSKRFVAETLTTGRSGGLVDIDSKSGGKRAYIALYTAESILNWRTKTVRGKEVLSQVVLQENYTEENTIDPFMLEEKPQWRVLKLDERELYVQEIWRQKKSTETKDASDTYYIFETIEPKRNGTRIDFIPFRFISADNHLTRISKPPLLDLVDVNLSHYRTSADLEHGAHYTALPTAWVAGFETDKDLVIGSSVAWVTNNSNASAGFLEYTGQGLGALSGLLKDKESMMAALGARLLEESKKAAESAEALEIRQSSENASLAGIIRTVSTGLEDMMNWVSWWSNPTAKTEANNFNLNMDFVATRMSPQELQALMGAWQGGGMSVDTFLWNLKRGEMLPEDRTIEDEKDLLDKDKPTDDMQDIIPIKRRFNVVQDEEGNTTGVEEA